MTAIILFFVVPSFSQTLTLDDSWSRAKAHLEDFRIVSEERKRDGLLATEGKLKLGPEFSLGSEWKGTRKEAGDQAATAGLTLGVKQTILRRGLLDGWEKANVFEELGGWSEREKNRQLWSQHLLVYYEALLAQARLKFANTTFEVVKRRQQEIERRYSLGRIRKSELLTNTSQFSKSRATQIEAEIRWESARQKLMEWVGELDKTVELAVPQLTKKPDLAGAKNAEWEERRPDLRELESRVRLAELDVALSTGELWPRVSVFANHFPWRSSTVETLENPVKWDVGVQLGWVIPFEMVFQTSRMQAKIDRTIAELKWQKSLRLARKDLSATRAELSQLEAQLGEISRARDLSKLALDETNRDFGAGTASLLDVVAQENSYWDVQRQYDELNLQRDLALWNLQWLEGDIP